MKYLTHNNINTIDSFQGQERDIIIISLVRSNDHSEIGFLTDYRRLNVAMTRARKKLIIIGDSEVTSSIIGFNATKRIRADAAAIQKITKVEWLVNKESVSPDDSQLDMSNTKKIWIKHKVKKSLSYCLILFTYSSLEPRK